MGGSALSAVRVLYVPPSDRPGSVDRLREAETEPNLAIEVAELPGPDEGNGNEGVGEYGADVDCVLVHYEHWERIGADHLRESVGSAVPFVVLVDASDGSVPAGALECEAEATVPIDSSTLAPEPVLEAVDSVVAAPSGPTIGDPYPPEGQSAREWKASVLDQLFTSLPLHLFVKDDQGRHVLINEAGEEEPGLWLGKPDIEHGIVPEEEARAAYEDDMRVVETGERIVDREEYYPSLGRWYLTTKVPLFDAEGSIQGLVGVTRDITGLKERERHLTVVNQLFRHALRNDLNVIRGWSHQLRSDGPDDLDRTTERIAEAVDRLLQKMNKQEEIVEILTGDAAPIPTDAVVLLRRTIDDLSDRYAEAEIHCDLPETARVQATPYVKRAIEELVENAIVHNDRDAPRVVLSAERADGDLRIEIADDAPPIPELEVNALVSDEPIDQLNHSSGLGLWLVHWIVHRCDGTLTFDTDGTRGNVVIVTVPLATDE